MFYTYILKSIKDKRLYIGATGDLRKRVKEHNSGAVRSTKGRIPFKLVYYEAYGAEEDAWKREHNLKLRTKALQQLMRRIEKSIASS